MHNESKSRFDHQQRADCGLPPPPPVVPRRHLSAAYLFISLTVCADGIKKSGNVALQQP